MCPISIHSTMYCTSTDRNFCDMLAKLNVENGGNILVFMRLMQALILIL